MKFTKTLSFILGLSMIISTLTGFTVVNAATKSVAANEAGFTNLVVNGDMEGNVNNWKPAGSVTGAVITLEEDSKDASNHVLRYDGTKITGGSISYVAYNDILTVGESYYYSYKIRMVESKTYTGDMFAYNNNHNGTNQLERPKLSTEWETRSGIFEAKKTSFNFKITSDIKNSGKNVADVIYELDDVAIFSTSDMYELTLPDNVKLEGGAKLLEFTESDLSTSAKYYAKAGQTVQIEYKGEKRLSVLDTNVTKLGDIYSFTMPSADAAVTLAEPPFTNLVVNGDMEGSVNNWNPSSSVTGAVTSLVEDYKDATNHVMRYDGTGITEGKTSFVSYSNLLTVGKSYYYSYKIRLVESETYTGDVFAYNRNYNATTELARPKLSTEWESRSGIFTAKQATYDFKITSDITDSSKNVTDVIYELDDVVIYETEYMNEIILPEGAQLISGGNVLPFTQSDLSTVNKYYATQDTEIKVKFTDERSLSIANISMKKDGDIYTFVMPDTSVTVSVTEPAFTNLIVNSDMEGSENKWKASSTVEGAVVSLVKDSNDPTNQVLRYDGTNITKGKISYVTYSGVLTVGKSYYYSYKIRIAEDNPYEGDMYSYNKNHTAHSGVARPKLSTGWTTRAGTFTAKDTSYNFKITSNDEDSNDNVANVIYELDDVVIYDFTYTNEIFLPAKATIQESKNVRTLPSSATADQIVDKYFAEVGAEVNFTYSGDKGLKADTEMTAAGDEYMFVMPEFPVTVSEVSAISFGVDDEIPNITVAKPQNLVVIVAKYSESSDMDDVFVADIETTLNNQVISLDDISEFSTITDWSGMYIYVWNSITDMMALSDAYICEF